MSMRHDPKMTLAAGVFLLVGLALAVFATFQLKSLSMSPKTRYFVALRLETGSAGLEAQAAVRIGGQRVGRVLSVETKPQEEMTSEQQTRLQDAQRGHRLRLGVAEGEVMTPAGRPLDYAAQFGTGPIVVVEIEAPTRYQIRRDARVDLDVPLLGAGASLNIPYIGSPNTEVLTEGDFIIGQLGSPLLLYQAGLDPEKVAFMIENVNATLTSARETVEEVRAEWVPRGTDLLDRGVGVVEDVRTVTTDVREKWPAWSERIDQTTANIADASENIDGTMTKANDFFDHASTLAGDAREVVAENRQDVRDIVASAKRTMHDVETTTRPNVDAAIDQYEAVAAQASTYLAQWKPILDQVMANVRLASGQLRLLAVEIRSQPWRVLHRPDTKELENQLLYDSSRSYATAVSDLRAASESVQALLAHAEQGRSVDPALLERLSVDLEQAFERYREAEEALLDTMIDRAGP